GTTLGNHSRLPELNQLKSFDVNDHAAGVPVRLHDESLLSLSSVDYQTPAAAVLRSNSRPQGFTNAPGQRSNENASSHLEHPTRQSPAESRLRVLQHEYRQKGTSSSSEPCPESSA